VTRVLEGALIEFPGCAMVISHDRFFLDRICTHLLIFEGNGKLKWFEGNFQAYEEKCLPPMPNISYTAENTINACHLTNLHLDIYINLHFAVQSVEKDLSC